MDSNFSVWFTTRGYGKTHREMSNIETKAAAMRTGTPFTALDALLGLAHLASAEGDREAAAGIAGLVLQHPATVEVDRGRAQLLLSELAADLPPEALRAAVARGQAKELEEAAAEMLEGCGDGAAGR